MDQPKASHRAKGAHRRRSRSPRRRVRSASAPSARRTAASSSSCSAIRWYVCVTRYSSLAPPRGGGTGRLPPLRGSFRKIINVLLLRATSWVRFSDRNWGPMPPGTAQVGKVLTAVPLLLNTTLYTKPQLRANCIHELAIACAKSTRQDLRGQNGRCLWGAEAKTH